MSMRNRFCIAILCMFCACGWSAERTTTRRGILNPEKEFSTQRGNAAKPSAPAKVMEAPAKPSAPANAKEEAEEEADDPSDNSVIGKLKRSKHGSC